MMACPDITIHYILVKWVFSFGQVIVLLLIYELMKYLWRLTKR
jgi:hypothetical protein